MEKGYILSSFSWGFVTTVFSGIVATKFGGTAIFGYGMLVTAICTIITPWLIHLNMAAFIVNRSIEGISEVVAQYRSKCCNPSTITQKRGFLKFFSNQKNFTQNFNKVHRRRRSTATRAQAKDLTLSKSFSVSKKSSTSIVYDHFTPNF